MDPEEVGKILDEIGSRVGPYGDAAWKIAVSGERVAGAVSLILTLLFAGVGIGAGIWLWRKGRQLNTPPVRNPDDPDDRYHYMSWHSGDGDGFQVSGACLTAVIFVIATFSLYFSLMSLIAPEYVILRGLLNA